MDSTNRYRLGWCGVGALVLFCVAAASAQTIQTGAPNDALVGNALRTAGAAADQLRSGEDCPPHALAWQDLTSGATWYFSDVQRCQACPSGTCCGRVRCENYPPPGVTIDRPIGVVSWWGIFVDQVTSNGDVHKAPLFKISFYPDHNGQPDRDHPLYSETVLCSEFISPIITVYFAPGSIPANAIRFTAVLTTPVNLPAGWISIEGVAAEPTHNICHVWGPSVHGDARFTQWFENPSTPVEVSTGIDLNYCLAEKPVGACCDDRHSLCNENVYEGNCVADGLYWLYNQPCSALNPPCGRGVGACCHDDGTCTITTARACLPYETFNCPGDLNCNGAVDFGDINPFVLALGDPNAYRHQFPNCPWPGNSDLNGDGLVNFDDINPFVACLSLGGGLCGAQPPYGPCIHQAPGQANVWLGRLRDPSHPNDPNDPHTCAHCCQLVCDPNTTIPEGEPTCHDGYVDRTNGGCNASPPAFTPVACGQSICAKSGTFQGAGGAPLRDEDWYRIFVNTPGTVFHVTVDAEFDVALTALGPGTCDPNDIANSYYHLGTTSGDKCTPTTLTTHCLQPGEYWFLVAPLADNGVPCGADYIVSFTCDSNCTPCTILAPPNCYVDPEPCWYGPDTLNGGCESTPYHFEHIAFDPNGTAELCGTLWAKNGRRDSDWYQFTIDSPRLVEIWWEAEFPGFGGLVTGADHGHTGAPTCADAVWSCGAFDPCAGLSLCNYDVLPAGTYWPVARIADSNGPLFDGYPCNTQNDYHMRVRAYLPPCPNLITCTGNPPWGPLEGEPNCHVGYVDTYNGGCDNTASPSYLPVSCDERFCAKSGTWVDNGTPKMDTDWYQITTTVSRQYIVTIVTEFTLELQVWKPGPANGCAGALLLEEYTIPACQNGTQDISLFHCLGTGTYWFRFSPQNPGVVAPCGANALNYHFWISGCDICTPCLTPCPPGGVAEGEPCGADTNGGCSSSPPQFATLNCDTTVCGTTWAAAGARDTDWYRIVRSQAGRFVFTLDTEVPLMALTITGTNPGHPTCQDQAGYLQMGITCNNGLGQQFTIPPVGVLPAGEYWLVLAPADALGNGIFYNYPCGGGMNQYWVKVECQ